jgi:hypothetical protein
MDEVTRDIQGDISWCMIFTDDVVLVDENKTGVDKMFRLSRSKTEYMKLILMLPHKMRGILDSMVRWYSRKIFFATWDRCSRKMGISMKMLVIELKSAG